MADIGIGATTGQASALTNAAAPPPPIPIPYRSALPKLNRALPPLLPLLLLLLLPRLLAPPLLLLPPPPPARPLALHMVGCRRDPAACSGMPNCPLALIETGLPPRAARLLLSCSVVEASCKGGSLRRCGASIRSAGTPTKQNALCRLSRCSGPQSVRPSSYCEGCEVAKRQFLIDATSGVTGLRREKPDSLMGCMLSGALASRADVAHAMHGSSARPNCVPVADRHQQEAHVTRASAGRPKFRVRQISSLDCLCWG